MTEIKYDVFISFRGKDTRTTLTSHLYKALCGKNIVTYKDDEKLESGDEISPSLLKAIQRSKISVVIFSKRFASSWWCLDELVHILDCRKRNGQFVIPIFYHVDPFHVRSQRESYATDFAKLEERFKDRLERLNGWRSALTEAANLSGFHYTDNSSMTESDLVEEIVKDIWRKLKRISSSYIKGLFGIEKRICQIESLLCLDSPNVCVIGIWGMGGIGKTTIAKVVLDQYSYKFEACCFLENVREELEKPGGMNLLRRTLFSEILSEENINIGTSSIRSTFVRDRLRYKKALIVLDDMNQAEQIGLLVGDIEDFGSGTRFIITSRDKQVLRNSTEQDKIYHVEELNCFEARKLFEFHAFKKSTAPKDYQDLCSGVVNYANGIPLALKILGSTLHSKSIEEWKDALDKLKKYPNDQIQGVLKLSYDRLDSEEKRIFLDIACFFKGEYKDRVIQILQGCKFFPVIGISNLIDKSLITIGHNNTIQMHDLIQEMGWDVVRKEPGNRSRVWIPEDVCRMLQGNTGTEQVEGIFYEIGQWVADKSHVCQERCLNKESFSKMNNVRLVKISYQAPSCWWTCKCNGKCKLHIPDGLKTLSFPSAPSLFHWDAYPLKSLPLNLDLSNLVQLQIPHSQVERLWDGNQPLWNLRKLDCSGSEHLIEIPDLSIAPNVEWLAFVDCINLAQLPHLQNLKSLRGLILSGCSNLKRLPELPGNINCLDISQTGIQELPSIEEAEKLSSLYPQNNIMHLDASFSSIEILLRLTKLHMSSLSNKSLEHLPTDFPKLKLLSELKITGCSKLEQFLKSLEPMENLETLDSGKIDIKTLPTSIMNSTGLTYLNLCNCENLEFLPNSICNLSCLVTLDLSSCTKLEKLPPLPASLSSLNISNCRNLKCLESFPVYAWELDAYNCESLEYFPSLKTQLSHGLWDQHLPFPSWWWWAKLSCGQNWAFDNCNCLSSDEKVCNEIIELSQFIIWRMANSINKELPFRHYAEISCPGNEIPKWFNHQIEGCSIHVDLPLHWLNSEFLGFALCIATDGNQNCKSSHAVDPIGDCHQHRHFKCKSHFKTNNNESYETDYCVGSWVQPMGCSRPGDFKRKLNSNHLFMFYYYPLHLQKMITYSGSEEGYCPYPNSTQASFTLYIDAVRRGDPCECWSVRKFGIRMLYAPDAKELGFVDVAKVEIATKHERKRDEPESSRSKRLCSVEIEKDVRSECQY